MEKKTETYKDKNGNNVTKTVITTTPEDGFVYQGDIRSMDYDLKGRYRMGYSKNVKYTTDDPVKIGLFGYSIILVFVIIGIVLCFTIGKSAPIGMKIFALYFLGFSLYCGYKFSQEHKEIRKKHAERQENDEPKE